MHPLTVLLTNDDGPPSDNHSPFIWSFYKHLTEKLGWDVKVVIPSTQKSWIGKAFHITEVTGGVYYYPRDPYGRGETSNVSRPLQEGELAEWILLDGTPATCANVAIHNIYPNQIDLVISGPNVGRNTSAAFALSSGTLGAALSSSLTTPSIRSLALSYAIVQRDPKPSTYLPQANSLAVDIIHRLCTSDWGLDPLGLRIRPGSDSDTNSQEGREVDLYSINIPLIPELLSEGGLSVLWTIMWRNMYGRLFKTLPSSSSTTSPTIPPEGPDVAHPAPSTASTATVLSPSAGSPLRFKFSPDMSHLIPGTLSTSAANKPPEGTDAWAINNGYASVTALRASFAEPAASFADTCAGEDAGGRKWMWEREREKL